MLDTDDILEELNEFTEPAVSEAEDSVELFCNSWDLYDLGPGGQSDSSPPTPEQPPATAAEPRNSLEAAGPRTSLRGGEPRKSLTQPECAVCLQGLEKSAKIVECNHEFCEECLLHWSTKCTTCPLCRTQYQKIRLANGKLRKMKAVVQVSSSSEASSSSSEESSAPAPRRARLRRRTSAIGGGMRCGVCRDRMNARLALECEICFAKFHSRCLSVRLSTALGCPVCFSCGMEMEPERVTVIR